MYGYSARQCIFDTTDSRGSESSRCGGNLPILKRYMEALPGKVVRMRALDAQAMDQLTGDVKDELDRMNVEIQSFEETLTTLGDAARGV